MLNSVYLKFNQFEIEKSSTISDCTLMDLNLLNVWSDYQIIFGFNSESGFGIKVLTNEAK